MAESQDTEPSFISALKVLARSAPQQFCLGFFGDPMQKIYMTGVGVIDLEEGWQTIEKPENFRCPLSVLRVINGIRAEADDLEQTRGRMIEQDGDLVPLQGTARLFILPSDNRRTEHLSNVINWLAEHNNDPLWLSNEVDGDVRMLVIVHRIAASRLGFPNLYSALNDRAPENLKSGVIDGTAWIVRPFIRYLLPLIQAYRSGNDFKVMSILKQFCPRLKTERLILVDVATELETLKIDIESLSEQIASGDDFDLGAVLSFVREHDLIELDERFEPALLSYSVGVNVDENTPENSPLRFMYCDSVEIFGYQTYIEEQSPFATQQGIKGAEFDRVLVIVDDEESTTNSFSYGKYFGITPLSDRDRNNIAEGKETVVDKTRRLFYVCCSRAVQDLAVVFFAQDVAEFNSAIEAKGFFDSEDIHCLDV